MPAETILIVEDEPAMLRGLRDNFEYEGYCVMTAADGETGLQMAVDRRPDLIVLDIMLPKVNGYEICRLIRREGLDVPIIMLTAKGQETDIVLGLNLGADDYVTKPFSIKELLARANAFLRRRRQRQEKSYSFGRFRLDCGSHKLAKDGSEVPLTPKEFELLVLLVSHPQRAFSRDEILRLVWGYDVIVTSRSVDRCINTLRAKIEHDPSQPQFIRTVRDVGYRFEAGQEGEDLGRCVPPPSS